MAHYVKHRHTNCVLHRHNRGIPVWNPSFSKGPVESASTSRVEHARDAANLIVGSKVLNKLSKLSRCISGVTRSELSKDKVRRPRGSLARSPLDFKYNIKNKL